MTALAAAAVIVAAGGAGAWSSSRHPVNSLGNLLKGQLSGDVGWLALPWQTVVFCSLDFLVIFFGIRPRFGRRL